MERIRVRVCALNPVTSAGIGSCLEPYADVQAVTGDADVVVAAFDRLSAEAVAALREQAGRPVVLVIGRFLEEELPLAVECRVVAVLPTAAVTDERLIDSVRAAAVGEANLPSNLLGRLVEQTELLYREVLAPAGLSLSTREIDVLRLVADGLDTTEIAAALSYSERTVKNIVSALTKRLRVRNRSHAVALALRAGVI